MKGAERLLAAARCGPVDRPPVWFMRQAGRSLPEYRELRETHGFLDLVRTPELATEVTLQPVRRFGVDGAILFSDILVLAEGMGVRVDFAPGPVIENPVRDRAAAEALRVPDPEEAVPYVLEALAMLRRELDGRAAVIGFAGAPFTVASYLVDDRGSKSHRMRTWLRSEPEAARIVLERITEATSRYLRAQVEAGAQVLQLFDTGAGVLAAPEFRAWALPHARRCLEAVEGKVPTIYIALESSHLLEVAAESGADVLSVDWRRPLDAVRSAVGPDPALQGNLDPAALFAPPPVVAEEVRKVLAAHPGPGHIFNLGHGVLPDTPLEGLETAVRTVQES